MRFGSPGCAFRILLTSRLLCVKNAATFHSLLLSARIRVWGVFQKILMYCSLKNLYYNAHSTSVAETKFLVLDGDVVHGEDIYDSHIQRLS